jgi:hypothetical protein
MLRLIYRINPVYQADLLARLSVNRADGPLNRADGPLIRIDPGAWGRNAVTVNKWQR